MNRTFFVVFILSSCLLLSFSKKQHKYTKEQAIKIAENFIRDNGYTSHPVDTFKHKIHREFMYDDYRSLSEVIKARYNHLYPSAFCISYDTTRSRWYVGFLSSTVDFNKLDSAALKSNLPGKSVIIDEKDGDVWMAHKTPLFSQFQKL